MVTPIGWAHLIIGTGMFILGLYGMLAGWNWILPPLANVGLAFSGAGLAGMAWCTEFHPVKKHVVDQEWIMGERFEIGGLWERLSIQELRGAHYALNLVLALPNVDVKRLIDEATRAMVTRNPALLTTNRVRECPDRRHEPRLSGHAMTFPLCRNEGVERTTYCSTVLLCGACPRGYSSEEELQ
jgi:hypothetical protein